MNWKTSTWIKRYISKLSPGAVFTTRELLGYGSRSAVDQILAKMNGTTYVERLSYGIYWKGGFGARQPSILDVAYAKARACGKLVHVMPIPQLPSANIREADVLKNVRGATIAVCGGTTSFRYMGRKITLRGTSCHFHARIRREQAVTHIAASEITILRPPAANRRDLYQGP